MIRSTSHALTYVIIPSRGFVPQHPGSLEYCNGCDVDGKLEPFGCAMNALSETTPTYVNSKNAIPNHTVARFASVKSVNCLLVRYINKVMARDLCLGRIANCC